MAVSGYRQAAIGFCEKFLKEEIDAEGVQQ
jgi:hypothetical protein